MAGTRCASTKRNNVMTLLFFVEKNLLHTVRRSVTTTVRAQMCQILTNLNSELEAHAVTEGTSFSSQFL